MAESNAKRHNILSHLRQLRPIEHFWLVVFFIILLGTLMIGGYCQWQNILHDKKLYIELIGKSKISQIEIWYTAHITEAKEKPHSLPFLNLVSRAIAEPSTDNLELLDESLRPSLLSYNYADTAVLTSSFDVLYTLTNLSTSNSSEVVREISERKPRTPFFTRMYLTSPHAKAGFHLVIPLIWEGEEEPFAYVVHTIFAENYFFPILATWPGTEETGEVMLLESSNNMVQVINPLKLVPISAFSLQISIAAENSVEAQAGLGKTGVMTGKDYRGKQVLAYAEKIPNLDWIILSKLDWAEAFASLIPTIVVFIIFIFVAIIALLAGSYVIFSTRALATFQSKFELLKRTERNEALLSTILERLDFPVVAVDENLEIRLANHSFRDRFGDTLPKDLQLAHKDTKTAQTEVQRIEIAGPQGQTLRFDSTEIQIALPDQPMLFVYVMRDVTNLETMLEQVNNLNRELAQKVEEQTKCLSDTNDEWRAIASAISYNLIAPLYNIESLSKSLEALAKNKSDSEIMSYITNIRKTTESMTRLTEALSIFLSIDTIQLADEEFDFSIAAQEITSEIIKRNPKRRYQITIMPDLKVHGDGNLLKIALRNVLENAIQNCPETLTAMIEIGKCGESCIFVQDNGIGISPEEVYSLLKPFSNTENGQSAGQINVDFAITKKIIERHGGKLEIISELDKGTVVRFDFSSKSTTLR